MKLAIAQISHGRDKKENLDKIVTLIKEYGAECDFILFPEACMGLKTENVSLSDMAEDVQTGGFISAVKSACAETGVYACVCIWEKSGTAKVYNTAAVVSPKGEIVAEYRKLHLFDALSVKESDDMLCGGSLPHMFEICGIKCVLGICYDLRFPEVFRSGVFAGAELILLPAAWYAGDNKLYHLNILLAARAIENTAYVACADVCGGLFTGHSAVYSPFGLPEAAAGDEESVIIAEINSGKTVKVREILPCLKNITPEIKKMYFFE